MTFLTMTIKYLLELFRDLLNPIYGTFLGEVFYNNSGAFIECFMGPFKRGVLQLFQKILKVCSGSVLEQTKVHSRTVLEQTIRIFLELFWTHSKMF